MRNTVAFFIPLGAPLFEKNPQAGVGGAERQFFLFGRELARRGYSVSYYIKRTNLPLAPTSDYRLVQVRMRSFGGHKGWFILDALELLLLLVLKRPRYFIVKTAPQFFIAPVIAKIVGVRLIVWGQTSTSFDKVVSGEPCFNRLIRCIAIRQSCKCVAQTAYQLQRLSSGFGRKGVLIKNITMPANNIAGSRGVALLTKPYILWVGNATSNKRPEIVVELARLMPELQFAVAMNPGDQKIWREVEHAAQQSRNMTFLGTVRSDEIDRYFANCILLVHTAVREGFPNTFLQAWQYGKPVVSVNIDPDGVIRQFGLGECAYYDDRHLSLPCQQVAKELSEKIQQVLKSDMQACSRRCEDYIKSNHSPEVCGQKLIEIVS